MYKLRTPEIKKEVSDKTHGIYGNRDVRIRIITAANKLLECYYHCTFVETGQLLFSALLSFFQDATPPFPNSIFPYPLVALDPE
jgi:hypothetical protein